MDREQLLKIFFIQNNKKLKFNESLYRSLSKDDLRRFSLDNFYKDSCCLGETCARLKLNLSEKPTCPVCGKTLKWIHSKRKFQNHCSHRCASLDKITQEKHKKTCLQKYNIENYNNHEQQEKTMLKKHGVKSALCGESSFRKKSEETCLKKYGSKTYRIDQNELNQKCFSKYGSARNSAKIKQTMKQKYGHESFLSTEKIKQIRNSKEVQEKINITKRKNHSFNTSCPEEKAYLMLINVFGEENVLRQYKSNVYPFACDFYIKPLDLYLELNFHWTHGGHPFNPLNENDCKKLKHWKSKTGKFYNKAIEVWTQRDPLKIKTLKENKLNYKIFYNIEGFNLWIKDAFIKSRIRSMGKFI